MLAPFQGLPSGYGIIPLIRNAAIATILAFAPAWAEPVTVAALGDSLTQGYGLPSEQGFVPVLQQWLRDRGAAVEMINAGVSGDTTAGGLSRIEWTLTPDVDALIVALGGNDVLRGIPPETARANLDGILKLASERGIPVLLVGLDAPSNYGPDYKAAFDAIYPELADRYGALLYPDFLAPLRNRADRAATLRDLMQPDGVHPNAAGVALVVDAIGPSVLDLVARFR